jgi:hypothetical protein
MKSFFITLVLVAIGTLILAIITGCNHDNQILRGNGQAAPAPYGYEKLCREAPGPECPK